MEEFPAWATVLISIFAFVIGAGTVGKWLARLLQAGAEAERVERLGKNFAAREELNGFRAAIRLEVDTLRKQADLATHQVELAMSTAAKTAEIVRDQSRSLESFQTQMLREALGPISKMEEQMVQIVKELAANTALVKRIFEEYDRDRRRDGSL